MGVMDGAHEYTSRESQMGASQRTTGGSSMYNIKDIMDRINATKRRASYTRQEFVNDYQYLATALGFLVDNRMYGKSLIFSLINIKLDHGQDAMLDELKKIKRQKRERN